MYSKLRANNIAPRALSWTIRAMQDVVHFLLTLGANADLKRKLNL